MWRVFSFVTLVLLTLIIFIFVVKYFGSSSDVGNENLPDQLTNDFNPMINAPFFRIIEIDSSNFKMSLEHIFPENLANKRV